MSDARQFEELVAWQRMHELKLEVDKATQDVAAISDVDFCEQIRRAADSAERHIVDGFGHSKPLVFAYFLDFARTSASATRSLLRRGLECGYFSAENFDKLDQLVVRALQSVTSFQRYLRRSSTAKRNATGRYQRPHTAPRQVFKNQSSAQNDSKDSNDPKGR